MAVPFATASYTLSRAAFIGTHLVFAYWLNYLFNDPFDLEGKLGLQGYITTLDFPADQIKSEEECTPFIWDNAKSNLLFFAGWWGTHSGLARKAYKEAVGLWQHPIERPLFAIIATIFWGLNVFYWKPISDCGRFEPTELPAWAWTISGLVLAAGSALIVGLLWTLPNHVFGTAKYKYEQGKEPQHGIIRTFPYGLVRHPAAAGFLWAYWSLPSYTANHIFLATIWTVFILVGTTFEEGGLEGDSGEFGKIYAEYREEVNAFFPNPRSIASVFGCPFAPTQKSLKKAN